MPEFDGSRQGVEGARDARWREGSRRSRGRHVARSTASKDIEDGVGLAILGASVIGKGDCIRA